MVYSPSDARPARIFISHADEDNEFAKAIIVLLSAIGVDTKNSILCTSESELGIKAGRDWVDELRRNFTDYRTFVIIIHSSHLYTSPVSMNEMGAAWVIGCPIFSFLVNGFMEASMAGVLTSNHQAVLVGRKDISPYIDQLRNEVTSLFGLEAISEDVWKEARDKFINTVSELPADHGIVKEQFDVNQIEHILIEETQMFDEGVNREEKDIKWVDILKIVDPALRKPHTEASIEDALLKVYPGIKHENVQTIINKLHQFGLAETHTVNNEFDGVSVVWNFTEKGRNAYERALNLHLQPIYQARDKAQVKELMCYFSTFAMDAYIKEGPYVVTDILLSSRDAWKYIIGGSAFQIFNPSLIAVLKPFYELFLEMTNHGECYEADGSGRYRMFMPSYGSVNKKDEMTINWLIENMLEFSKRYRTFIEYVKAQFPVIDLKETSKRFERNCS